MHLRILGSSISLNWAVVNEALIYFYRAAKSIRQLGDPSRALYAKILVFQHQMGD